MNSITSATTGQYNLQYKVQTTSSAQDIPQAAKSAEGQQAKKAASQPRINLNTLLNEETNATMFALTQNNQQSAGILTREIASLSGLYTPLERLMNDMSQSFYYMTAVSNPRETMERTQKDYDSFMQEAQSVVDEMKAMDDTGLLEFRYTEAGPSVEVNSAFKNLANAPSSPANWQRLVAAQGKMIDIREWITDNSEKHSAITEKGAEHIYAKAAFDHEAATGISRDDAIHKGADAIQGYTLTIGRNASNHYGVNPMSVEESTARFGKPGEFYNAPR